MNPPASMPRPAARALSLYHRVQAPYTHLRDQFPQEATGVTCPTGDAGVNSELKKLPLSVDYPPRCIRSMRAVAMRARSEHVSTMVTSARAPAHA